MKTLIRSLSLMSLTISFASPLLAAKTPVHLDSNSEIERPQSADGESANAPAPRAKSARSKHALSSNNANNSSNVSGVSSKGESRGLFRDEETGMEFNRVNNVRLFPLNLINTAVHIGYERLVNAHIAAGGEASIMGSAHNNSFIGDSFYQTRENYVGALGQFYFSRGFEGFFFEAGLNYMQVEVSSTYQYMPTTPFYAGGPVSATQKNSGSFWMPHASVNYRLPLALLEGLNATAGIGIMNYIGESIQYRTTQYPNYIGYKDMDTEYTAGTHLRVRLDVGYSF